MSDDELEHFGIPGMRWGRRKPELPSSSETPHHITPTQQIQNAARRQAGIEASRVLIDKYGATAVRVSSKTAAKSARLVFNRRTARGSIVAVKILGRTAAGSARVITRGGKAYVRGAISIGRAIARL